MPAALDDIEGTKVCVLGIGILGGGQGVARYLISHGAMVRASDMRAEADFPPDAIAELRALGCVLTFGEHPAGDVDWADIVFRNPAVRQEAPILQYARRAGKRIEMEISFFAARCPAPLVIVTGSKGKTTTTSLLQQLLAAGLRRRVVMAGNMGVSALAALDSLGPDDLVLLEVSSFLLEEAPAGGWSPHVAVITNVGDDHLDRYHHDIAEYRAVKLSLAAGQAPGDWLVVPAWDHAIISGTDSARATRVFVHDSRDGSRLVTGQRPELFVDGGQFVATGLDVGPHPRPAVLGAIAELPLHGAHNATNFLLAAGAALTVGVQPASIAAAVPTLRPVAHRLETIGTHDGLTFVDDTTATAPMAVVAALDALPDQSAIVICGGHDKGADFAPMIASIAGHARGAVLLRGTGTDRFATDLVGHLGDRVTMADSMPEAVEAAIALAHNTGASTVLLSPGCASFGGFRNEFDRAERFTTTVRALATTKRRFDV